MTKWLKGSVVVGLLSLFILFRFFEETLFYDPLLVFFKTDHTTMPLPDFEFGKLLLNLAFRYLLNTAISLAILWVVFTNKSILQFSALLYGILFFILMLTFAVLLVYSEAGDHLALFYVRRFLIQPILLLLLLPAFYAQRLRK